MAKKKKEKDFAPHGFFAVRSESAEQRRLREERKNQIWQCSAVLLTLLIFLCWFYEMFLL